jgi:hypothetical protein
MRREPTAIRSQHDVRIEQDDQPFEIAVAIAREEPIDDTPLLLQIVCVRDAPLNALPHCPDLVVETPV